MSNEKREYYTEGDIHTGGGDFITHDKVVYGDEVHGPKIIHARSELEAINDYLAHAVSAYEAQMYQYLAPQATLPDQPYKFLYAFDIEDVPIFFGRSAASEALHKTILKERLTIVHADSGAGKTSLLNAGLAPRLICEGRLPIYARAYEDPVLAIKRTIAPPSLGPWPALLPKLTLQEFLGLVCTRLSRRSNELVIILDQFEEFFVFWPEQNHRQPFIDTLAACCADRSLPTRFVISIRSDYFSHLATFQDRLPHIFHNEYYLEAMSREEAQTAVTGPISRLDHSLSYERILLNELLDDLARGGMELPYLQIICTRLCETLAPGETVITLAAYRKLGSAEGVLRRYLDDVLRSLPVDEGRIAREVLKEMVSSKATKRVLVYDTLVSRIDASKKQLEKVLLQLVDARLLRREVAHGKTTYEMVHEYLITEIGGWIDRDELEFKQAEDLLEREVMNWRVYRTRIPRDRLELLYGHREQFKSFDSDTTQCILDSALHTDSAVADWARLSGAAGEKFLLETLGDPSRKIRQIATRALGSLWGLPTLSRLGNSSLNERQEAAGILGRLGDPHTTIPLIAALQDEDWRLRQAILHSLSTIWAIPELSRLGDGKWRVRQEAARVLGKRKDPRTVEPLSVVLRFEKRLDVRCTMAKALGQIGDSRATEALAVGLQSSDVHMRKAVVWSLGQIGGSASIELLSEILDDQDVREAARDALRNIGESVIPFLLVRLQDKDGRICLSAAKALGEIGDLDTVEPLLATLRNADQGLRQVILQSLSTIWKLPEVLRLGDSDPERRRIAANSLGHLGDSRCIQPLEVIALEDDDLSVRRAAARALGRIRDPQAVLALVASLHDVRAEVRSVSAGALGKIGDPRAVEPLTLALQDRSIRVRMAAIGALGEIKHQSAMKPLLGVLRTGDTASRKAVARALGRRSSQDALEPLAGLLRDTDAEVQCAAASALSQAKDPRAVEHLLTALRVGSRRLRKAAVEALGEIGDARAEEPLAATLQDKDADIRRSAARALAALGQPASKALAEVLRTEDWHLRQIAVEALKRMGGPAMESLITVLHDSNTNARGDAAKILAEIGEPSVKPLIEVLQDQDVDTRRAAVEALGRITSPDVTAALIEHLYDEHELVRRDVVEALGQIGDSTAAMSLAGVLHDPARVVRISAARVLGRIGDRRVVEALITALKDQDVDVRVEATKALGELNDPRAIAFLAEALEDRDSSVQRAAYSALRSIGTTEALNALRDRR